MTEVQRARESRTQSPWALALALAALLLPALAGLALKPAANAAAKEQVAYWKIARASLSRHIFSKDWLHYLEEHGSIEVLTPQSFAFEAKCKPRFASYPQNLQRTFTPEATTETSTSCEGFSETETYEAGSSSYANPNQVLAGIRMIATLAESFADVGTNAFPDDPSKIELFPQRDTAVVTYPNGRIVVARHRAHAYLNP